MDFKLSSTGPNDIIWHNGPLLKEDTTQSQVEVTGQRVLIRLRTWMGEWFMNTTYGPPYEQQILANKRTSKQAVDLILQQQVFLDSGVKEIVSWESTYVNRKYFLVFRIKVIDGTVSQLLVLNSLS